MSLFRRLGRKSGAKPAHKDTKPAPPAPARKKGWEFPDLGLFWWLMIVVVGIYYAFSGRSGRNAQISAAQENAPSLACVRHYTIQSGDTLDSIVQKTGVSEANLTYFNPTALIFLSVGTELCLPDSAAIPTPVPTLDFGQYYQPAAAFAVDGQTVVILPGTGFGPPERLYLPIFNHP